MPQEWLGKSPKYNAIASPSVIQNTIAINTYPLYLPTPVLNIFDYWNYSLLRTAAYDDSTLVISWLAEDRNTYLTFVNVNTLSSVQTKINPSITQLAKPMVGKNEKAQGVEITIPPAKTLNEKNRTLVFKDQLLYSFVVHDQSIVGLFADVEEKSQRALAYLPTKSIYIKKYNFNGTELWSSKLIGDETLLMLWNKQFDSDVGNSACVGTQMAWSGKYYSAIIPHFTHCNDGVNHQMDSWFMIDTSGRVQNLVQYPYWVSSHSFAQRIIADRDSFIAASANDAYPRGISLHILNPKLHSNRGLDAIFRRHTRHAQADAFNDSLIGIKAKVLLPISGAIGDNNIRGTQLGGLLAAQDKVLLTFCTGDTTRSAKELQDVGVIIATRNGNVQKQTWLTQTPDTAEMNVRTSWIGNGNVLVVWDVFVRPEKPELFATTFPPPNTGKETKGDWKFLYSECMIVDQYGDIVSKAQKFDMQYSRENISTTYRRTRSYNSVTMVNGDVFIVRMTNDSTRFDITQFINTRRPLLPINAMMVSQTERERTSFVQEIKKPIVFTVTTCERCRDFKSLLEQRGIEYIELIIDKDIKNNEKMWQYLGKTGINSSVALPVVVIGKEVISCNSNEEFPIILGKIVK